MAEPNEKLASSLELLEQFHSAGRRVFRSSEFTRVHRERLVRHGFLLDVMKGWLISASPTTQAGDSTPWYASFWEFCAAYCAARFGEAWHLSASQSLLLHAGNAGIPRQVMIMAAAGSNNVTNLPFDTAILDLRATQPDNGDVVSVNGLRLLSTTAALVRIPEAFFRSNPVEAQVALGQVRDSSDVLRPLLAGGHTRAAGRIAGALRRLGRDNAASDIVATMRAADFDVRERDPFDAAHTFADIVAAAPRPDRPRTLGQLEP